MHKITQCSITFISRGGSPVSNDDGSSVLNADIFWMYNVAIGWKVTVSLIFAQCAYF